MSAIPTTAITELMAKNRRETKGLTYTVPSPDTYPYQWFWDSCFHAIILSHLDPQVAQEELLTLIAAQYESGMIAHVMYWKRGEILDVAWQNPDTSDLIQPPIIALATERVFATSGDHAFLERMYPALVRYYDWLLQERDVRGVNLLGYVNPDESGEDNSPRFDHMLDLPPQHPVEDNLKKRYDLFATHKDCNLNAACTAKTFWVEDVPLNSLLVTNLEALARLASELGERADSKRFTAAAKQVVEAMRQHMWQNDRFLPLSSLAGNPSSDDTWARFLPLFSQQFTTEEAAHLINTELLHEDQFWLPAGVPTVAATAASFDPAEPTWGKEWQHPHWRGPIWIAAHWFLYHGLKNYKYDDLAEAIKHKSLDLIAREGFREYYDPTSGTGMGARDFTWGALVIDMQ